MLSGLVGAGAQQGLEELLTQQLLEAKAQEEKRQAKAREAMQAKQLALSERGQTFDEKRHADTADANERKRRDENNRTGLEQMARDRAAMIEDENRARALSDRDKLLSALEGMRGDLGPGAAFSAEADILGGKSPSFKTKSETEAERQARVADEIAIARGRERAQRDFTERGASGQGGSSSGTAEDYSQERESRVLQSVDELLGRVNRWTTGIGSLLSDIPETDAKSFKAQLNTLKSNIAFNELTQMRAASKTGGALGNVSNVELALLESALGALDQAQRPEEFKAQLERVRGSIERWQRARSEQSGAPDKPGIRPMSSHGDGAATKKPKFEIVG